MGEDEMPNPEGACVGDELDPINEPSSTTSDVPDYADGGEPVEMEPVDAMPVPAAVGSRKEKKRYPCQLDGARKVEAVINRYNGEIDALSEPLDGLELTFLQMSRTEGFIERYIAADASVRRLQRMDRGLFSRRRMSQPDKDAHALLQTKLARLHIPTEVSQCIDYLWSLRSSRGQIFEKIKRIKRSIYRIGGEEGNGGLIDANTRGGPTRFGPEMTADLLEQDGTQRAIQDALQFRDAMYNFPELQEFGRLGYVLPESLATDVGIWDGDHYDKRKIMNRAIAWGLACKCAAFLKMDVDEQSVQRILRFTQKMNFALSQPVVPISTAEVTDLVSSWLRSQGNDVPPLVICAISMLGPVLTACEDWDPVYAKKMLMMSVLTYLRRDKTDKRFPIARQMASYCATKLVNEMRYLSRLVDRHVM